MLQDHRLRYCQIISFDFLPRFCFCQVHNAAIIRLQLDKCALRANLQPAQTPEQGICDKGAFGLVKDVVPVKPTLLRDNSVLVGVNNRNIADAVKHI